MDLALNNLQYAIKPNQTKNYRISTLREYSLWLFFYLAVNRLKTGNVQNIFWCCIAEKNNNTDVQDYNLLLFFFLYYLKCTYE